MEQNAQDGIAVIVAKESWTAEDHRDLLRLLFAQKDAPRKFRAVLSQLEDKDPQPKGVAALKIGIARYMLCRHHDALAVLADATDNKDRRYFQGLCQKALGRYDKAIEEFERARQMGWDAAQIDQELVEAQALSGNFDAAAKALAKLTNKLGENPDMLYLHGLIDELRGLYPQAVASYEKARALNPAHVPATFRLAFYQDLHGEEAAAMDLYKQCLTHPPIYMNALMNLAVMNEDMGRYEEAARLLRHILVINPHHARARLFLKDVESSKTMFFDEDQAKRMARRNAVMDIPVTDFELSVRARNCLKKMNIHSLGDLVRTTESDLLGYKNFGETSLKEIKDMLTSKGLRLGQGSEDEELSELAPAAAAPAAPAPPQDQGALSLPIGQVDLSIRARKAMEGLKITTLGELANKTEAELLACRNFGQTSLNEVRQRLQEHGLHLKEQ